MKKKLRKFKKNKKNINGKSENQDKNLNNEKNKSFSQNIDVELIKKKLKKTKTIEKIEIKKKKRFTKIEIPIIFKSFLKIKKQNLQYSIDLEKKMEEFDKNSLAQLSVRNDLETYVLNAQNDFSDGGIYFNYMTKEESENFIKEIFIMDDWISSDVEMNKSITEYFQKLTMLKSVGDKYKLRYSEYIKRSQNLDFLQTTLKKIQIWISEIEESKPEIKEKETMKEFLKKYSEITIWFKEKLNEHNLLQKDNNPAYKAKEIIDKLNVLNKDFVEVKNIPKSIPFNEENKK